MNREELIRVVIVEDDRATRDGLAMLLDGTPGYQCVGKFGSVEDALRGWVEEPPHVLLLDIHLPGMTGTDGIRLLRERFPETQILMLTVYAHDDKVFESICRGAGGYLLKTTPPAKLLEAIREAVSGGAPMSPEIARKVIHMFQKYGPSGPIERRLSPQEARLIGLLAHGYSYQSIAEELDITINTVRNHIRSIYEKLHVHSRSEAVAKALRSGLL